MHEASPARRWMHLVASSFVIERVRRATRTRDGGPRIGWPVTRER
jgi:hypothetical protein